MDKIKLEILGLSGSQSQSGTFALVLGEQHKNRRLPIVIGMFEAQAIAIELENISSARPMTHDLFKSFSREFDFEVEEILISQLKEGVFYAEISCTDKRSGVKSIIDARPSDAIAIALRFSAPVFTTEAIMQEAGIVLSEIDEEEVSGGTEQAEPQSFSEQEEAQSSGSIQDMTQKQLEELLEDAISDEDYEKAALIRDEIERRKG